MEGNSDRADVTAGEPGHDPELIAAFLDGRLQGEERARAIRAIADSDDSLEVFANALRARDGVESRVIPISAGGRGRVWRIAAPLAAAAVIAVVLVPAVLRRGGSVEPGAADLVATLARNPRFAAQLGTGWEQRTWRVTRGGEPSDVAASTARESALAFRLGVRTVDLRVAIVNGDAALASRLATDMADMLRGIGFSDAEAGMHRDLAARLATGDRAAILEQAAAAERGLGTLLGTSAFGFGKWVGAAELAARTGDSAFFQADQAGKFVRSAAGRGELTAKEAGELEAVLSRAQSGFTAPDFQELQSLLQTVIRRRAG